GIGVDTLTVVLIRCYVHLIYDSPSPTRRSSDLQQKICTTRFALGAKCGGRADEAGAGSAARACSRSRSHASAMPPSPPAVFQRRSEEHTSELQSLRHLVCRLLLEKKKKIIFIRQ